MLLTPYYHLENGVIRISAQQASRFAKIECSDYNPLHNIDNKRFCVPGDLLFSLALHFYGVSECMSFSFSSMVGADMGLIFPQTNANVIIIKNEAGKDVLEIVRSGTIKKTPTFVNSMIKNYVSFSGQNFPALLMPLMQEHQVMFNPTRPLVMYHSMSFHFDDMQSLDVDQEIQLKLESTEMEVQGKRANNFLNFTLFSEQKKIGSGVKKLIVAGLKTYDHKAITAFAEAYEAGRNKT